MNPGWAIGAINSKGPLERASGIRFPRQVGAVSRGFDGISPSKSKHGQPLASCSSESNPYPRCLRNLGPAHVSDVFVNFIRAHDGRPALNKDWGRLRGELAPGQSLVTLA
jgi:hypothetical protein